MQTVIVTFIPHIGEAERLIDALTRDFPRVGDEIPGALANRLFHLGDDRLLNIVYFESEQVFRQAERYFREHLERMRPYVDHVAYELAQPVFSTPNFADLTSQMHAIRYITAETEPA